MTQHSLPSPDFGRRIFLRAAAALAAAASLPLSAAEPSRDGRALLDAFLARVSAAEGAFRQETRDRLGKLVSSAEGRFAFMRPKSFSWSYESPWKQRVVSDGVTLWLYDEDLAQVTVKRADDALAATPAAVLFGEGRLGDGWKIESVEDAVKLTPSEPLAGFESVSILFDRSGNPEQMLLADSFGQKTLIAFENFAPKTSIDASRFVFEIPEGADVLRDA